MQRDWQAVAAAQAGVISGRDLTESGITRARRDVLLAEGVLARSGRGVYIHTLDTGVDAWEQQLWLAIVSGGPGAIAYRRAAAAWWGLDGCPRDNIEVAVPPGRQSRLKVAHRPANLPSDHVTCYRGVPITTAARTLADLGARTDEGVVERALECALRRKLVAVQGLQRLLATAGMAGWGVLRLVLDRRADNAAPTESDAETLFLQLARSRGLPEPRRQYVVILQGRKYRLDFAWPELRIAVEIDGASVHAVPNALRSDLLRQNRIILDGWTVLRYTWFDIVHHPRDIVCPELLSAWAMRGGLAPASV